MADDTRPPPDAPSTRTLDARLTRRLSELRDADLYRVRRVIGGTHGVRVEVDGRPCLNFCSNDYLGLASDPRVSRAAQRALQECGTGSGASALISGYNREHRLLEEALAEFTGYPRVLLFTSGWAANCGVLRGLLGRDDVLIADELNHASLIDGGRLSGAQYLRAAHADPGSFAEKLQSVSPIADRESRITAVVTDSVFSMDGDLAPLPQLSALCAQHGAVLMTDDAHGFGVLGSQGRGAVEALQQTIPDSSFAPRNSIPAPDIYVATMGKSLGAAGAFVAGSEALIEYLIQRARSFVFSTAPPPAIAAAAREALRITVDEPALRAQLHANIARFTHGAAQLGIRLGPPAAEHAGLTPIQPLLIGDSAQTMKASRALFERGYWVAGIRPPTVAAGTARLRITLSAGHRPDHIDGLLDAMRACGLGRS